MEIITIESVSSDSSGVVPPCLCGNRPENTYRNNRITGNQKLGNTCEEIIWEINMAINENKWTITEKIHVK